MKKLCLLLSIGLAVIITSHISSLQASQQPQLCNCGGSGNQPRR